jgi:hypothetical protein
MRFFFLFFEGFRVEVLHGFNPLVVRFGCECTDKAEASGRVSHKHSRDQQVTVTLA